MEKHVPGTQERCRESEDRSAADGFHIFSPRAPRLSEREQRRRRGMFVDEPTPSPPEKPRRGETKPDSCHRADVL